MSRLIEVDTKTFVRFWLVVAAIGIAGMFLWRARTGLILVGLSIFLSIAIRPFVKKVHRLGKGKISENAAAGIAVGAIVLFLGVFLATVGPMIIGETAKFLSNAPATMESSGFLEGINELGQRLGIEDLSGELVEMVRRFSTDFLANLSNSVITSVSALANFLTALILVIVLTILCLIQAPAIANGFWRKIDGKNGKTGAVVKRIMDKIADVIAKYVGGQVVVAFIDGCVVGVTVFIMSLLFGFSSGLAFPLAMISFIFVLIPMFGAIIAAVLLSLLLFFQNPVAGICFLAFYAIYLQVENNVISPRIQANSLDLPSLAILMAVTIGMYMFGLAGAIISIPIAGIIKVIVDEYPAIRALEQA